MADVNQSEMPPAQIASGDLRLEALKVFKDWSNYLLVTTVAALGWVAKENQMPSVAMSFAVWCFGISAVSGIFTLALVPLIAEQVNGHASIFTVPAQFYLGGRKLRTMFLSQACRPQHVAFILGIASYCVAATELPVPIVIPNEWILKLRLLSPTTLIVLFLLIGLSSHRKAPEHGPSTADGAADQDRGGVRDVEAR